MPGPIAWSAVSTDDGDAFGVDLSATGQFVSNVDIHSRFGNVRIGGRDVSTLVYERIPWTSYSLVLYQALAVEAHGWTVFWFYCRGSSLEYVYWEITSSPTLGGANLHGTCTPTTSTHATVSWPAVSMTAPTPVTGFYAHGEQIDIWSGASGRVMLDGLVWTVYPYLIVDCTKECGSPGWYELHALLWDSSYRDAAYGIFYMLPGEKHRVSLDYTFEVPGLLRLTNESYVADWYRTSG
jgi:hypothetical protein